MSVKNTDIEKYDIIEKLIVVEKILGSNERAVN